MEIGCDGLEKHGVIGLGTFFDQRRYQRRVCGARGDVMVYSYITEAIKVDIVVRWTASRSWLCRKLIEVSMLEHVSRLHKRRSLNPAPNSGVGFNNIPESLAMPLHSHRSKLSSQKIH